MQSIAGRDHVQQLFGEMNSPITGIAALAGNCKSITKSGKSEYTWAVRRFWEEYRNRQEKNNARNWTLYPNEKQVGEFLVDFMLIEDGYGPRIACESEWDHKRGCIEWDFDKLCGVKSDIKVLIHQCDDPGLEEVLKANYLVGNALVTPDEAFVLVRFDGGESTAQWWKPSRRGPFNADEINFEPVAG